MGFGEFSIYRESTRDICGVERFSLNTSVNQYQFAITEFAIIANPVQHACVRTGCRDGVVSGLVALQSGSRVERSFHYALAVRLLHGSWKRAHRILEAADGGVNGELQFLDFVVVLDETRGGEPLHEVDVLIHRSRQLGVDRRILMSNGERGRAVGEHRSQIVDVTPSVYTIQLAGTSDKLDSFIQAIGTAAILEVVRSGVTGISRGDKVLSI